MNMRVALGVVGLTLGAIGMIRSAIWAPLLIFGTRTWLHLAIGLAPLPFLKANGRHKYLCYATLMAGAAGTLLLGASYLGCSHDDIFCAVHAKESKLLFAALCYVGMLGGGLWWLGRLSRQAKFR